MNSPRLPSRASLCIFLRRCAAAGTAVILTVFFLWRPDAAEGRRPAPAPPVPCSAACPAGPPAVFPAPPASNARMGALPEENPGGLMNAEPGAGMLRAGNPERPVLSEQQSLQHAIISARHAVEPLNPEETALARNAGASHFCTNPGQKFQARFLKDGAVKLTGSQEGSSWQGILRLAAGTGLPGIPPRAAGWRGGEAGDVTEIRRHAASGLVEWYKNRPEGLEHGFLVEQRPAQAEEDSFSLTMKLEGLGVETEKETETAPAGKSGADAVPSERHTGPVETAAGLQFIDPGSGRPVLAYRGLKVHDATGRLLAATLHPAAGGLHIRVRDKGAVYPVTVDPLITSLEGRLATEEKILAPDGMGGGSGPAHFGRAVALDGETALVGAPTAYSSGTVWSGAAYVFVRRGDRWVLQQKLVPGDGAPGDSFGYAVALSGSTALVGAPMKEEGTGEKTGAAYAFVRNGSTWTQQQKLPATEIRAGDEFGWAVALEGGTALVSAWKRLGAGSESGSVYAFTRSGTLWNQHQKLTAGDSGAGDRFGSALALQGNTAVIGADRKSAGSTARAGAAYVFVKSGSTWSQKLKLQPLEARASGNFGASVALDGNRLLAGAPFRDGFGYAPPGLGRAYLYEISSDRSLAVESRQFSASDASSWDNFGDAVAVEGGTALIGAGAWNSPSGQPEAGAVYFFANYGGDWAERARIIPRDSSSTALFGSAVALDGGRALAGAWGDSQRAGAVYYYGGWPAVPGDHLGLSVSLEGDTAAAGALDHDLAGMDRAGAAWILTRSGSVWTPAWKLTDNQPGTGDRFGVAVALSGSQLAVGADYDDAPGKADCGSVSLFARRNPDWTLAGKFSPAPAGSALGRAVALHGRDLVAGAPMHTGGQGSVWAWTPSRIAGEWDVSVLAAATPDGVPSRQDRANFGFSVAVSGGRMVVGEPARDISLGAGITFPNCGRLYFFDFDRSTDTWNPVPVLTFSRNSPNDSLGFSLAMEGHTAVSGNTSPAGWFLDSGSVVPGSALVFTHDGTAWGSTPQSLDSSGFEAAAHFGSAVSVNEDLVAVGAFGNGAQAGRVRVFQRQGSQWALQTDLAAPVEEAAAADTFGISTALSSRTLMVGAYGVRSETGSAYVYRITDASAGIPLTISLQDTHVVLKWPEGTGLALWRSPGMAPGSWIKVAGTENATAFSFPLSAAPRMFFRLAPP